MSTMHTITIPVFFLTVLIVALLVRYLGWLGVLAFCGWYGVQVAMGFSYGLFKSWSDPLSSSAFVAGLIGGCLGIIAGWLWRRRRPSKLPRELPWEGNRASEEHVAKLVREANERRGKQTRRGE